MDNRPASSHSAAVEELLPHDKLAEQAVLGSVILRNELFPQLQDIIEPVDFFSPTNQHIFEAMAELAETEIPIDEITLCSWLSDHQRMDENASADYLLLLTQTTPVADNAEYYANIVREKSQLRAVISTAYELAKEGQEGTKELSIFLTEATEKLRSIESRVHERSYTRLKHILLANFERLEKLSKNPQTITGIPTGFMELDELTRGLQKGDLIILAARPSMGKTAFAINVGLYAAMHQSLPVLMFSLEMPKETHCHALGL